MKCNICNEKKAKRFCKRMNSNICSQCCGKNRSLELCDSFCEYFSKEKYNLIKTGGIKLTEVGRGKVFNFSESLFIPNIYEYLRFDVTDFKINVKSSTLISIKLSFIIKNNCNRIIDIKEAYYCDEWKNNDKHLLPFLQIYTIGAGNIKRIKLICNGIQENVSIENNHNDTWLPFSIIKNEKISFADIKKYQLPKDLSTAPVTYGKYFAGKNSTLLSNIELNKKYDLDFDIEYNVTSVTDNKIFIPFGIFIPFKLVNFFNYKYNSIKECSINNNSIIQLLLPFDDKKINCFMEPLENCNYLSSPSLIQYNLNEIESNFHYDNYCILNHMFYIDNSDSSLINVKFRDFPIFTSIYDTFNKVYNNDYSPVSVSIYNNSEFIKKYSVEVLIQDLSFSYEDEVYVEPKTLSTFNIAPQLISDKVESITSNCEKNINVKIFDNKNIILNSTKKYLVYPKNIFVEKITNGQLDFEIDFRSFLARWITPNSKEIDEIISIASKSMDMSGNNPNQFDVEAQIKNIYDTLCNMKYAIRSISFPEGEYHTQRINFPKDTYKLKSGNCIDLSLLMASCFEALKLQTYIYLIPGHAFVGVKINEDYLIQIETTVIGKKEYCEACDIGREKYDKYFVNNEAKSDSAFVLDLSIARKSKIFPIN